jgi:uncharacterized protein YqfA (UPF0365 family)
MGHLVVDMAGVLASLSVLGTAVGAGLRWLWKRAKASGRAQERREIERRAQALTQEQLQKAEEQLQKIVARQAELEREIKQLRGRRRWH